MKSKIRNILLVVAFFVAIVALSGCRQRHQYQTKEEIVRVGEVPSLSVTVTGHVEDLEVTLISPVGTRETKSTSTAVMIANMMVTTPKHGEYDMNKGLEVINFPLHGLGEYTLIVRNDDEEMVKKTIKITGEGRGISIAKE